MVFDGIYRKRFEISNLKLFCDDEEMQVRRLHPIKIMALSTRSLINISKELLLMNLAYSENNDILCLCETWPDESFVKICFRLKFLNLSAEETYRLVLTVAQTYFVVKYQIQKNRSDLDIYCTAFLYFGLSGLVSLYPQLQKD